ncbi:MAG: beta-galactosidase [SAR202 cluster bacterium]|jgi:beta-galactosidase|nr:beta-galactosidase [SAR202 cluster bacterium]MDP6713885.1 beta-galactosidase [SAR202 cluster bacterium]
MRPEVKKNLPAFPYGAVYFRKSNPPQQDWQRDYQVASEDGMNMFRHWFMWSAIEVAPGKYDWDEYDRQLDLARDNGIKTMIAEMITAAPEWAFRQFSHARFETVDGDRIGSQMGGSSATGGFPGLCLDNEDVKDIAGRFLTELATHYQSHPSLAGYDVWNECNFRPETCYCPATAVKLRAWLKDRYGDLKTLGDAWYRHSYADWEDIEPPRYGGPYPDYLDWLEFRIDNAFRLMRWRVETIRRVDQEHLIAGHGVAAALDRMATGGADDWKAASEVEVYGLTWVASRKGDQPWKQWHAVDLTRASSRGKPFWHAEAQGGPLWMQPQVTGRPLDDGRVATPEDIRLWNLITFAAGGRGFLYPRWRPLLDGPLFGAFGAYGMDGSRTPKSEMVSAMAVWANAPEQQGLWDADPVKGDIGIVYVPESQLHCQAQQGNTDFYSQSVWGAYQGFFDNNIQADWVHIDHIDEYDLLYLPFPVMLSEAHCDKLIQWVKNGGSLISEGCPAYFGDRGKVGTVQPNFGLDELFGASESYVEFTPDLNDDLRFNTGGNGHSVCGGLYIQKYALQGGKDVGWFDDGDIAVVENAHGKGKTLLIGTFPGYGYFHHDSPSSREFFAGLLKWIGSAQHVESSNPVITARLQQGGGGLYLWAVNPSRAPQKTRLTVSGNWTLSGQTRTLWGDQAPTTEGQSVRLEINGRDGMVIALAQTD